MPQFADPRPSRASLCQRCRSTLTLVQPCSACAVSAGRGTHVAQRPGASPPSRVRPRGPVRRSRDLARSLTTITPPAPATADAVPGRTHVHGVVTAAPQSRAVPRSTALSTAIAVVLTIWVVLLLIELVTALLVPLLLLGLLFYVVVGRGPHMPRGRSMLPFLLMRGGRGGRGGRRDGGERFTTVVRVATATGTRTLRLETAEPPALDLGDEVEARVLPNLGGQATVMRLRNLTSGTVEGHQGTGGNAVRLVILAVLLVPLLPTLIGLFA